MPQSVVPSRGVPKPVLQSCPLFSSIYCIFISIISLCLPGCAVLTQEVLSHLSPRVTVCLFSVILFHLLSSVSLWMRILSWVCVSLCWVTLKVTLWIWGPTWDYQPCPFLVHLDHLQEGARLSSLPLEELTALCFHPQDTQLSPAEHASASGAEWGEWGSRVCGDSGGGSLQGPVKTPGLALFLLPPTVPDSHCLSLFPPFGCFLSVMLICLSSFLFLLFGVRGKGYGRFLVCHLIWNPQIFLYFQKKILWNKAKLLLLCFLINIGIQRLLHDSFYVFLFIFMTLFKTSQVKYFLTCILLSPSVLWTVVAILPSDIRPSSVLSNRSWNKYRDCRQGDEMETYVTFTGCLPRSRGSPYVTWFNWHKNSVSYGLLWLQTFYGWGLGGLEGWGNLPTLTGLGSIIET